MAKLRKHSIEWRDQDGQPWNVELRFVRSSAGRWQLSGVSVDAPEPSPADDEPPDPVPLTTTTLRQLHLARLVAEAQEFRRTLNREAVHSGAVWVTRSTSSMGPWPMTSRQRKLSKAEAVVVLDQLDDVHHPSRAGRPTFWSRDQLAEVARIYREAWAIGENPTHAVASHLHKSRSMAAKLVAMARRAEPPLLPPTTQGRALGAEKPRLSRHKPVKEGKRR